MKAFIYLECRIGKTVGLSDSLIKKTRRDLLVPEEDFKKVDGRVAYTEEAVAKLFGFLQGSKSSAVARSKIPAMDVSEILSAAQVQAAPAEKQPLLLPLPWTLWAVPDAVLIVARIFPRNSKIMHAKLHPEWIKKNGAAYKSKTGIDPDQATHRIKVRSTQKFVVGMEVPCRWKQSDLWLCTRRMPYRKGRWN